MDLNEIEREADLLAGKLVLEATGRNEALLLGVQIEGLKDLATIKALRDSRAEHNVAVDLRQRELAAMEQVAANMPTAAPCGEASPEIVLAGSNMGRHYCRYPTGHAGLHRSPQGTEWGGSRCGHRWEWGTHPGPYSETNPEHYEICTLPENHVGSHRNEVTGVSAVATEPTGNPFELEDLIHAMWIDEPKTEREYGIWLAKAYARGHQARLSGQSEEGEPT